jgi:hypothetical protein
MKIIKIVLRVMKKGLIFLFDSALGSYRLYDREYVH